MGVGDMTPQELREATFAGLAILMFFAIWLAFGLNRDADAVIEKYPDSEYSSAAGCGKLFVNLVVVGVVVAVIMILIGAPLAHR